MTREERAWAKKIGRQIKGETQRLEKMIQDVIEEASKQGATADEAANTVVKKLDEIAQNVWLSDKMIWKIAHYQMTRAGLR